MKKVITTPYKHRLQFAAKNKETWQFIKEGKKKVETRAGTVKYQRVSAGDILVLCCAGKHFEKKVKKVSHVKSISALLKKYKPGLINPGVKTQKEMEAMYFSYPGYQDKIKEFGILAFELE